MLILATYVLCLFGVSKIALGSWVPTTTEKGLWFYSGLAALLLGNLLVTPFFTKPVDTISYGVAAIIALLAVNVWSFPLYTDFDQFLWWIVTSYVGLVITSSIISIVLKDSQHSFWQGLSKLLYIFCDTAGSAKAIFSSVFLFALVSFHRHTVRECLPISIAWAVIVGLHPLEALADLAGRFFDLWKARQPAEYLGEIIGHETPGIVLIRHDKNVCVSLGDLLIARSDDGHPGLALALDYIGIADGLWLRAMHVSVKSEFRDRLRNLMSQHACADEAVMRLDIPTAKELGLSEDVLEKKSNLVGLVAPNTDISRLRFEVLRTDIDLEEGRLVEVTIGTRLVLYQIINGLTKEEIIHQKNVCGYVQADAKKIGNWNQNQGRFEVVKWVPQPNAPVFLAEQRIAQAHKDSIGHFPQTSYPVSIDLGSLVTHNAAILGILGAGKSFLALELIERMIALNIKVVCFDLTNQYAKELAIYYDMRHESRRIKALQNVGRKGRNKVRQNVEEGGSIQEFKSLVLKYLRRFLEPVTKDHLVIINPTAFEVWRQDSKPFQRNASMATLTPCEITRIFTEATLEVFQNQGMSDQAKCCLVFEEAHSLIPEWNAVATEGDKTATNGTAKAILQGRKYGLGCLVITQRTANVTKSILNQCNTVFALRVFDATGMEFLKNYIGEDYASVLSTLEDRHAVVFGRASSCRNPVLIRLNDREDFVQVFRADSAV
jgi:DNA helicase HerA-like ATPase